MDTLRNRGHVAPSASPPSASLQEREPHIFSPSSAAGESHVSHEYGVTASHAAALDMPLARSPTTGRQVLRFLRHFVEMVFAMLLGMGAFALLNGVLLVPLGFPYLSARLGHPKGYSLAMAVAMTAPMVAWMQYRKHARRLTVEMAGAMIVPVILLLFVCSVGILPRTIEVAGTHILMLPSMLGAMLYRRRHYSHH